MHEEIRALNLEAIKEQILNKLGLKQAPNMTGRALPKIPPISKLMDLYGMQADEPVILREQSLPGTKHYYDEVDEFTAKTESVFALAHPRSRLRHTEQDYLNILYFKFSDKIMQHRVTRAKLSLWIWESKPKTETDKKDKKDPEDKDKEESKSHYYNYNHHHHHHHNHHHYQRHYHQHEHKDVLSITLQRILPLKDSDNPQELSLGPPLITKHLIARHPGEESGFWVTIELARMVTEWFRHPRNNLGVILKLNDDQEAASNVTGSETRPDSVWNVETNPEAEFAPYLEIQMQEPESKRGSRVKRNVGLNCDEASQETRCCRYKLTVDFEKFGWDWIIAPKKYDANYCSGDCPMAFLPAYPNTHIVSLAEPPNNTGPCCAPRRLSEITMLYFDNEYQIVFSRLPGMVVERCGCS
ncbi:hypothetical protein G9C98_001130 [Cotesia typhae]|uniref:TGF-beta family profile domain-containing protein n=2 Tax=Cotesia typhae TaxID=2053667 RepID=A0A8J5UQA3_9HYME|nr:hypothetical protein G9C98_001130 [Cotesia typhae]